MKKMLALLMLLVFVMTLISSIVVMAEPLSSEEQAIEDAAEEIKDRIIRIVKSVGVIVIIISICLIGFGMLFGGGTDLSKYKGRIGIIFLGIILMLKAEQIGKWLWKLFS